jgi:hypothetical protein
MPEISVSCCEKDLAEEEVVYEDDVFLVKRIFSYEFGAAVVFIVFLLSFGLFHHKRRIRKGKMNK